MKPRDKIPPVLRLRHGDLVEVRSEAEILATLDERGTLDGLPFMPEMLAYCGKQLRVHKRADKTCARMGEMRPRRMRNAVHLETRCDGGAHDGCQAGCLIFWKEAWLKRVGRENPDRAHDAAQTQQEGAPRCTHEALLAAAKKPDPSDPASGPIYMCQNTELPRATTALKWWDFRQYAREVWCGNTTLVHAARVLGLAAFNALQRRRRGSTFPRFHEGKLTKTPAIHLDLNAGDWVRVKTYDEILATLDRRYRNRGLRFDIEMLPHCGEMHRVRTRVERIINEETGKMLLMKHDCIILENVYCRSLYSRNRLLCPRAIYPYWREAWLERAEVPDSPPLTPFAPTDPERTRTPARRP